MPGPVFIDGDHIALKTIEEEDFDFLQRWLNHPKIRLPLGNTDLYDDNKMGAYFEGQIPDENSLNLLICVEESTNDDNGQEKQNDTPEKSREVQNGLEKETPVGEMRVPWIDQNNSTAIIKYWISPAYRRLGYATEAVALSLSHLFENCGINKIKATVIESNRPSKNMLESMGFIKEGKARQECFFNGEYKDILQYSMLFDEWNNNIE